MGMPYMGQPPPNTVPGVIMELDRQLSILTSKKNEITSQIGRLYLNNNDSKTAEGTIYEELVKEAEKLMEEMSAVEKRKFAAQGQRKCEKCGNILILDSLFCNKCGEKLEPLFVPTEQSPLICEKCGKPYTEGAVFCTGCGNRLSQNG